ncbi:MAG TPA: alginate export family protein [Burkholderiales bacterium]|jgi:hypothetical protein|nr:alginate export family protein [Burkholderiales bacterium]
MRSASRVAIGILSLALSVLANAQDAGSLSEALTGGKPILNLRPRLEIVDQDGRPENGHALTLRTLAGWRTGPWRGFGATLEAIDVGRANDSYNDGLNGKNQYPVIADPDNTDVNQLYVDYTGAPATVVRAGRQSIKLDNVRFVGNVEFRQVMQVFNGITAENRSLPRTRVYLGYLGRLKTVNTRQHKTDTVLANLRYALSETESVAGFGYFQDQADAIARAAFSGAAPTDTSNRILGARLDGARPLRAPWKLLYTLEYADQAGYADGDGRIDAHYLRIGAGAQWNQVYARIDRELLASDDGRYAFQTPLGTNHLFQGWADQFLTTPPQGIDDLFFSAGAKAGKAQLLAEYHRFDSDVGGLDFGSEFDFSVAYPLRAKLLGKFEYADYQAGDVAAGSPRDIRKIWLTLIYNY